MNCLEADTLLQRHFDGEIPANLAFSLERHLQRCLSCRMEFDKLRREMRDLIVDVAEPRFDADRLRAQIAQTISSLRPRHPIPAAPLSVTLCLLLAGFLGWNLFQPDANQGAPSLMQEPTSGQSRLILPQAEIEMDASAEFCDGIPHSLQAGTATVRVLRHAGPFLLETPAGTIVCREGSFRVGIEGSQKATTLLVLEGEVGLDNASGSRKLKAGEAVFLKNYSPER